MKKYQVSVDVVMNKYIEVEANSDEEAANKVNEMITNSPYEYANNFSHYVGHEVISTEEVAQLLGLKKVQVAYMPQKYVTILAQQYHQYENDNAHIPAQDMGKYKQALRLIYG